MVVFFRYPLFPLIIASACKFQQPFIHIISISKPNHFTIILNKKYPIRNEKVFVLDCTFCHFYRIKLKSWEYRINSVQCKDKIFSNYEAVNCGRWPKEVWLRIQNDGSLRWAMKAVLFAEEEEQHVR